MEDRKLTFNPAAAAHRLSQDRPEMKTWLAGELRAFYSQTQDLPSVPLPSYPLWRLAASTGMRRGEVLGIRWRDIDLDAARLSVRQQVASIRRKGADGKVEVIWGGSPLSWTASEQTPIRERIMWPTVRPTKRKSTALLGVFPILLTACGTSVGPGALPVASPTHKASLADVQVIAEGIGGRSVGAVLKNVSQNYAFAFSYKATLYDAQGAQVGIFSMFPDVNLLPGQMVSIDGGGDATAPAVRFILTLNTDHFACAYPVLKMSKVPAPVPLAPGVWTKTKTTFAGEHPGYVTGTLQVPTPRQGLTAQALLYDSAGHLTGLAGSDKLTTADGPTPVHIVFDESFTYSGFPNPWGPVAQAKVSAVDDIQPLLDTGALGDCQALLSA